ncbi:protein SRC2-like [Amaranthus tricolor]|uniref:protein SRC2-like n=1 Tax=Amaranthus tricolor TaxID=29722 RepID=UPI00258CCD73|nr:protein SRC2-like [Amaranthus tricolor]
MVYKTLEITLISAKDLKNVNLIGKMDPYVVVHISDEPKNKQKTPVHQDGGINPSWNYTMRFTFDDSTATKPGKYLIMTLKHEQTFGSDKDLGEVLVPLKELLDGFKDPNSSQFVTYQVKRVSSGKPQGELKLSYKIMDMNQNLGSSSSSGVPYPPTVGYGGGAPYPPPYQHGGSVYPPPQSHGPYPPVEGYPPKAQPQSSVAAGVPYPPPEGYPPKAHSQSHGPYPPPEGHPPKEQSQAHSVASGVPYPPPAGYPHGTGVPYAAGAPHGYPPYGGYPPPPPPHVGGSGAYGYGYPPQGGYPNPSYPPAGYGQKPQKPKKNNFGMGLGAGLLGGAIGGLVLGDMVDDAFDVDCDF